MMIILGCVIMLSELVRDVPGVGSVHPTFSVGALYGFRMFSKKIA